MDEREKRTRSGPQRKKSNRWLKTTLIFASIFFIVSLPVLIFSGYATIVYYAWFGNLDTAGTPIRSEVPKAELVQRRMEQYSDAGWGQWNTNSTAQILFGDMHVHTTFSWDAFALNLPILQGKGSHVPADACDFARFCSRLDFWGISDHAESLTPEFWQETRNAIRQCNSITNPEEPDLVSFLGWEWTQTGRTPELHYGHKNVFFPDDEEVPDRPISSVPIKSNQIISAFNILLASVDYPNRQRYYDYQKTNLQRGMVAPCREDVPSPELAKDCNEVAYTPEVLFRKLREWGMPSLVIPHGNAWGLTAPMGARFDNQLGNNNDPSIQRLIEVYSGHGNSEEYRPWTEVQWDLNGSPICPEQQAGYTPGCWLAGQIIYQDCLKDGGALSLCNKKRDVAEQNYINAGLNAGFQTLSGVGADDWKLSNQCADCFLPAFNYIPASSVQYALALRRWDSDGSPLDFRFGFIAASDTHRAAPGTGYKEFARTFMTDTGPGPADASLRKLLMGGDKSDGKPVSRALPGGGGLSLASIARGSYSTYSFTGGLTAVHSASRKREDIWAALENRHVYGTSGERILLWFDLVNPPQDENNEQQTTAETPADSLPMGSETTMDQTPRFRVRAAGSFKQQSGCPQYSIDALGAEGVKNLCLGECYNPRDKRYRIERIEVIRILPQKTPSEPIEQLVADPWRVFECEADANNVSGACEVSFTDEEFASMERDALYYVRVLQEPTEVVNGRMNACLETDTDGECVRYRWCYDELDPNSDCLALDRERAWSSPIFIDFKRQPTTELLPETPEEPQPVPVSLAK